MHRPKEREGAASPGPVYYSPQQMSSYLQDLRNNRPARPTGSRPPPAHFNTWSSRTGPRFSDVPSALPFNEFGAKDTSVASEAPPPAAAESKSHRRRTSNMSIDEILATAGRPLVQPPRGRDVTRPSTERTPSGQYRESGQRQLERQEARSLRIAMEELDIQAEQGLYEAARDEAADLVWKHQNPDAPGSNPNSAYPYPGIARKGSHQRTRSVGRAEQDLQRMNSKQRKRNSMGSSVSGSRSSSVQSRRAASGSDSSVTGNAGFSTSPTKDAFFGDKIKDSATLPKTSSEPGNARRRSSSGRRKISASLFKNPNDQIYEEPEEDASSAPTPVTINAAPPPAATEPPKIAKLPLGVRRNPFTRFQSIKENNLMRSNTDPIVSVKRFDRYEIHNNPPSQSRNAAYTSNSLPLKTTDDGKSDAENDPEAKTKDGKEVRGDDIRAATGFRLKDRSAKLPTPTMVSDSPGRPIVSFKKDWMPKEVELKEEISPQPNSAPRPLDQSVAGPRPLRKAYTVPVVPTANAFEEPKSQVTVPASSGPAPVAPAATSAQAPAPSQAATPIAAATPKMVAGSSTTSSARVSRGQAPAISVYEDPPTRPLPNANSNTTSRQANTLPSGSPHMPTINVSQAPPTRFKPASTNMVQETPSISVSTPGGRSPGVKASPIPSISVSESPASRRGPKVNAPSISVTPDIPMISVSESPAPRRGPTVNTPSISVTPDIPMISVSESPAIRRGPKVNAPSISVTPDIPTIAISESPAPNRGAKVNAPSISVTPSVPSINVSGAGGSTRPLPNPKHHASRPFAQKGAANARSHWTPTNVRTGALCTQCALPIAGRIVSAAGHRFHPECFLCHHCGEHLECVAFYPEPENKHAERVSRIQARMRGDDIEFLPTHPTADDMARLEDEDGVDESPRFFCHLDFHEMFSPRCKSCKTPIEGEVIVACGAEWHAGHFFCAQCGDPFDSTTPFVEKDGYAWCVDCHTNRYSTKCKKCRKPVTDTVVKALGSEWHVGCFCCMECSGPFDDGRYFIRGDSQDPVCVKCEERRLKA